MVVITRYRQKRGQDGKIYIICKEDVVCPLCAAELKVIGIRDRYVINSAGDRDTLVIRRLRCVICHRIHHELPDMVIPYKRHCAETVEKIIGCDAEDACCDFRIEARIRAWWAAFRMYFENIRAALRMKYGSVFPPHPTPREIVRAVANANLWVHTRTVPTRT